jgi:EmrB/QacA subfamily drug resistance transporter
MTSTTEPEAPTLATARGRQILVLLCAVGFLDFVDASIVNVALPSIRDDLGFSIQNLQWVLGGYLLTYGGFILLGGRAADLLGRRRILLAGTTLFMVSSAAAGLAQDDGLLVAARLVQGVGSAMMVPAALSTLMTVFTVEQDRNKALGIWGALAGLASAVGVFLGGLIAAGPGWRWVFVVNLPVCVAILIATMRLIQHDGPRRREGSFDVLGALLVTAGMLVLVYAIVEAPANGWSAASTITELVAAGVLLTGFAAHELRHSNPLVPFSIFRIKGLAAANLTQVIAIAAFYAMFFLVTLYMQNVLGFSQVEAGSAYLPATFGVAIAAGIGAQLIGRIGTRPVIVAGALLGSAGLFWLSRIPADGTYLGDLLAPLLVMSSGLGAVFVGVTTAAQIGVPAERSGLAAALINASTWVGGALGVAILSAVATSRTDDVLGAGGTPPVALTEGFQNALLIGAVLLLAAAVIALRATNAGAATPEDTDELDESAAAV